jgi:hypothetical protein
MKTYDTYIIRSKEMLDSCPVFHVDNVLWNSKIAPVTEGRMGYIKGLGLFVRMKSDDPDPLRTMTNHMDMVCRDSAVEAFFAFPDVPYQFEIKCMKDGALKPVWTSAQPHHKQSVDSELVSATEPDDYRPDDDGLYFNFEINANGAMYAKTGRGRKGRSPLLPEEMEAAGVRARLLPGGWETEFLLPLPLLRRLVGIDEYKPGDVFFCNFYKISENPDIEHYLAFSPIESETPNFHLPRFFAKAILRELS